MKILALGDLHGVLPKNLKSLVEREKVDLVIQVGEIPNVPFQRKKGETYKCADKID